MTRLLAQFWRLLKLCISGKGGRFGIVLYLLVLALELASIPVTLKMIEWSKAFYDALQQLNGEEALRQVGVFVILVLLATLFSVGGTFASRKLEIRWRRSLTAALTDRWLKDGKYVGIERQRHDGKDAKLDNPDQRIAEDCRFFLAGPGAGHGSEIGLIALSIDLISKVVAIFSYMAVLWELSSYALPLSFIGLPFDLPRYLVWAAILFVLVSSGVTHWLGHPLKRLYSEQQRREADYRFSLVRVRENAEAIALSGGEAAERRDLDHRFSGIIGNFQRLIVQEVKLLSFNFPYQYTVLRIPTFIALPIYFAGAVTFGGLMQLASAFSQVVVTLSWFIFSYRRLADLVAASSRLDSFLDVVERPEAPSAELSRTPSPNGGLGVSGLTLSTPQGRPLLRVADLTVAPGEAVWLSGASGLGKTTLIKTIAGTWPHASGAIRNVAGESLYLPQQSYFPPGPILDIVAYPRVPESIPLAERKAAINAVGLGACLDFKDGGVLSGGEAQRLALARLLLLKPDWAFLDEATSALDVAAEAELLALVRRELPDTALVIVAHRRPSGLDALRTVTLDSTAAPRADTLLPA